MCHINYAVKRIATPSQNAASTLYVCVATLSQLKDKLYDFTVRPLSLKTLLCTKILGESGWGMWEEVESDKSSVLLPHELSRRPRGGASFPPTAEERLSGGGVGRGGGGV